MKVKVEKVIHPSAWINGISVGEVRVANIPPMRAHAVRNLASRFNRLLGEEKDRFLHVSYNSYAHRMAICAISMDQRALELNSFAQGMYHTQAHREGTYPRPQDGTLLVHPEVGTGGGTERYLAESSK